MKKFNIMDIEGMEFPSGRRTRVMYGANGYMQGKYFCQGFVDIYPGGSIPLHNHETIETYTILDGEGEITVGDETKHVTKGDTVYMDENVSHMLRNTGNTDLHLMFVYAPYVIVDHWAKEQSGEIK